MFSIISHWTNAHQYHTEGALVECLKLKRTENAEGCGKSWESQILQAWMVVSAEKRHSEKCDFIKDTNTMSQHLHTGQVAQINEDIPNTDGYTNFIGERRGEKKDLEGSQCQCLSVGEWLNISWSTYTGHKIDANLQYPRCPEVTLTGAMLRKQASKEYILYDFSHTIITN